VIEGILITPLRKFIDARGKVMHMLKATDPHFRGFGEIYFSTLYPRAIRGWHLHKQMTSNLSVVRGVVKLVLYDVRPTSETSGELCEIFLGPEDYKLVTIPPTIWYGFQAIGVEEAIIANCATMPHDPSEAERKAPFSPDIPYQWEI